jgi:bifunctional oligoribonuclease and PAP phosphatase NrnA
MQFIRSEVGEQGHVSILCHQNADADAACSALALQILLKKLHPDATIDVHFPEGVSASAKQLLENLGIDIRESSSLEKTRLVILVDTNALDQLGETGEELVRLNIPFIVIDHHHPHPETERLARRMIVDESASAAAEVVYRLFAAASEPVDLTTAMALLAAIFVETRHFLLARRSTFEVAAGLVEAGADPRHLTEALGVRMSRSERMARLKAAGRVQVASIGDWIVATSQLGSYQSSAARAMLALGAHIALVGGKVKDRVRVNMRSTEEFASKTGVHLGRDIAIPLGALFGGSGGGHPTAAGFYGTLAVEDTLKKSVERVRELLAPFRPNIAAD